ncbi:uncharacterized protein LOC144770829 isoform X2 [Lissotriton helveticus]
MDTREGWAEMRADTVPPRFCFEFERPFESTDVGLYEDSGLYRMRESGYYAEREESAVAPKCLWTSWSQCEEWDASLILGMGGFGSVYSARLRSVRPRLFAQLTYDELLTEKRTQGDPPETVRRLLTRVTEALTAAEQTLQSPGAEGHTSEASQRILTGALQLASAAHGRASSLCGASMGHGAPHEYARILLVTLAGHLSKAASLVGSYRESKERAAEPVGQDEAARASQRLSRELEALLVSMKSLLRIWDGAAQGLEDHQGEPPSSSPVSVGQGGGTTSQGGDTAGQGGDAEGQVGDIGGQVGDIGGQAGDIEGQGEDAWGQTEDAGGQAGDAGDAFHPLLMPLAKFESKAQYTVLTVQNLTGKQKYPPGCAMDLFRSLAEHLKEAAFSLYSYLVTKGWGEKSVTGQLPLLAGSGGEKQMDPESLSCDHGWTGFLKSVWKGQTKFLVLAAVSVLVIAGLVACLVVLRSNQHIEQQIQINGVQSSAAERGKGVGVLPPCGHGWIWYRNKCYYFSEAEGTWTEAKDSCAALDSALAMIDTQKELNFMLRYKGDYNHWIGLRREDNSQLWTWVNGTKFNKWFTVSDTSECAYLSYGQVKSLECDITNKWICTRMTINSI